MTGEFDYNDSIKLNLTHNSKHFTSIYYVAGTVLSIILIISKLQMRKLRPREVKQLSQGYTVKN